LTERDSCAEKRVTAIASLLEVAAGASHLVVQVLVLSEAA